jgi:hypothetical protein
VVEALRVYFESGQWLMEPVQLVSAELEVDSEGHPYLMAIYDHPYYHDRLGYRRPLDREPFVLTDLGSPAESMAGMIAQYEISEPVAPVDGMSDPDDTGTRWWTWPPVE